MSVHDDKDRPQARHDHNDGGAAPGHDHNAPDSGPTLRVKALEALLIEKGIVEADALDALVDTYEHRVEIGRASWGERV